MIANYFSPAPPQSHSLRNIELYAEMVWNYVKDWHDIIEKLPGLTLNVLEIK